MNRSDVIALLERLGAEEDEAVLKAARELHRTVSDAGLSWDDLLQPEPGPAEEPEPVRAKAGTPIDTTDDAELIDRLLARSDLTDDARGELTELKHDLAEGEFDASDSRYVRALAQRLEG